MQTEKVVLSYLTTKKDNRVWIGIVEAILGLAYLRFRPGGKIRLQKGFRITNDHSHPMKIGDYTINLQGLKRYCMGGSSVDLLNFKTPIFYSHYIFKELRPENREVLLKLCLESLNNLLETYHQNIMARDVLEDMKLMLETQLRFCHAENSDELDQELEKLHTYLHIHDDYLDSPLTKKNLEIWTSDLDILNKIADLFHKAYQACLEGRNYEPYLNDIRKYSEEAREKLEAFLMEIPRGN